MAVQSAPVLPQTPNVGLTQLTTGVAGGTFVVGYTGGANGSKITAISAINSSTASLNLQTVITSGGTNYFMNVVALPSNSGINGTLPPISAMGSWQAVDGDGNPYLFLASSAQTISYTLNTTMPTIGGFVQVITTAADF